MARYHYQLSRPVAYATHNWCTDEAQMRNMRFTSMWLERSKQTPLSIGIWTKECRYSSQIAEVLKEFAGLNKPRTTERLEELIIDLHWVVAIPIADEMEDSDTNFPLLKKLRVSVDLEDAEGREGPHSLRAHRFLSRIPPRAPRLQALAWEGSRFNPVLRGVVASLSIATSITEIELGTETSLSTAQCISILSILEHLRVCIFDDVWNFDENTSFSSLEPGIISTRHLRKLAIIGKTNPFLFLAKLNAPSLEILTIAATDWRVWDEITSESASTFSDFLSRSTPPLRELIVEEVPILHLEWKKCLGLMSKLEVLNVYEGHLFTHHTHILLTHIILESLARDHGGHDDEPPPAITNAFTCPRLRVLVLRGRVTAPDGLLAQLVEDRSAGQAEGSSRALEVIQVQFIEGPHNEDKERLQSLSAAEARVGRMMKVKVSGGRQ